MSFRYPRHRIHELVAARKAIFEGHQFEISVRGENAASFDTSLDLVDGPYVDLRFLGRAARRDDPSSYDTSLLIDQQRVRGIGYCAVGRNNFRAKRRVPAGWHQNICDPNMPTDDAEWNRHEALPSFSPSDFRDFVRQAADLWNIDLGLDREQQELL